jgi:hypothetical protein
MHGSPGDGGGGLRASPAASSRGGAALLGHAARTDRIAGYFSRLLPSPVACALLATTLGARAGAVVIAAAVMLSALSITCLLLRNGDP